MSIRNLTSGSTKKEKPNSTVVVTKALINLKQDFELSNEVLGNILGMNASTVSRFMKRGRISVGKPMEFSLLLIRVYRSLYAILGGNLEMMRHWLNTDNAHLHGKPIERLQELTGLVNTVQYLDAMRGRA